MNSTCIGESILSELIEVRTELRALRLELKLSKATNKTPRRVRYEKRRNLLKELSGALAFSSPWACATEVFLVLQGKSSVPDGMEAIVSKLQRDDECPKSVRGIYEAITDND